MPENHTVVGGITLANLNTIVVRREKIGFQLLSIDAKTDSGTNFNQLVFDDKMPNDGPYSQVFQLPPEPALNGKTMIYAGYAFIENNRVPIKLLR
jgi:hypothetical protein